MRRICITNNKGCTNVEVSQKNEADGEDQIVHSISVDPGQTVDLTVDSEVGVGEVGTAPEQTPETPEQQADREQSGTGSTPSDSGEGQQA
jgi:hypothetical protein